jgi:hypothetical protein
VTSPGKVDLLAGCIPGLRRAGRADLVAAVERRVERARGELVAAEA